MTDTLGQPNETLPLKGYRIDKDGVFQIVPTWGSKLWLASFSTAVIGMVAWGYIKTGDWGRFNGGGIVVFMLAVEWFKFAIDTWRPGDKRGRPIIRFDKDGQLIFCAPQRWLGKKAISLADTPCLTILGKKGRRHYQFSTRAPSKQLFPIEIQPNWGKSAESVADQWLRGLQEKGLLTLLEVPPPESFLEEVRRGH